MRPAAFCSCFDSYALIEFTPVLFLCTEVPLAQEILSMLKCQAVFCAIVSKIFKRLPLLVMRAAFSSVVMLGNKALWSRTCL